MNVSTFTSGRDCSRDVTYIVLEVAEDAIFIRRQHEEDNPHWRDIDRYWTGPFITLVDARDWASATDNDD